MEEYRPIFILLIRNAMLLVLMDILDNYLELIMSALVVMEVVMDAPDLAPIAYYVLPVILGKLGPMHAPLLVELDIMEILPLDYALSAPLDAQLVLWPLLLLAVLARLSLELLIISIMPILASLHAQILLEEQANMELVVVVAPLVKQHAKPAKEEMLMIV